MRFVSPYLLFFIWGAAALLALIFIGAVRRKKILTGYSDAQGYARLTAQANPQRRMLQAGLLVTAFISVVVALAGPEYGYRWETVKQKGVDLVVALDCSRSMLAEDIKPSRLERAKREIIDLLGMLTGDRVGLVAFSGEAFLQCPLTQDYSTFNIFLKALSPDFLPVGGTNLSAAVETAMSAFDPKTASDKAIIIITDGEQTADGDPIEAAKKAAEKDITIFCVGVGGDQGAPVPGKEGGFKKDTAGKIVLTRLDENTLKKMTDITGGAYVRSVAGDMDLDAIYKQQIRKKMDQQVLESSRRRVWENRFQWFIGLALLCLGAELFISVRRKEVLVLVAGCLLAASSPARAANVYPNIYNDVRDGKAAYDQEKYEDALKHFIDAQLKAPEDPQLYYNIGDAYYKTGDFESAENNYKKALSLAGDDSAFKKDILYNLGNTRFRRNDYEGAIEQYNKALELDPQDTQAKDNLELAKKKQEEEKQQQNQQQDQKQSGQNDKNQSAEDKNGQSQNQSGDQKKDQSGRNDKQQGQQSSGNQQQQDGQKQQDQTGNQSDKNKDEQKEGAPQPSAGDQNETPENAPKDKSAQQAPGANGQPQPQQPGQGDRRLDQLQDKPGAAMIPVYRGRKIEKDW